MIEEKMRIKFPRFKVTELLLLDCESKMRG